MTNTYVSDLLLLLSAIEGRDLTPEKLLKSAGFIFSVELVTSGDICEWKLCITDLGGLKERLPYLAGFKKGKDIYLEHKPEQTSSEAILIYLTENLTPF